MWESTVSGVSFPTEIFHEILDEVARLPKGGGTATLFRASQVSKGFATMALPRLYDALYIGTNTKADAFGGIDCASSQYRTRTLTVVATLGESQWERILERCHGLQELHLIGFEVETPGEILTHKALTCVKTLSLQHHILWRSRAHRPKEPFAIPFRLETLVASTRYTHCAITEQISSTSATTLHSLHCIGRRPFFYSFGTMLPVAQRLRTFVLPPVFLSLVAKLPFKLLYQLVRHATSLSVLAISFIDDVGEGEHPLFEVYLQTVLEATPASVHTLELTIPLRVLSARVLQIITDAASGLPSVTRVEFFGFSDSAIRSLPGWSTLIASWASRRTKIVIKPSI